MIYIGIDTGVHTGIAVWNSRKKAFEEIETTKIHRAMDIVRKWQGCQPDGEVTVIFEDARQRKWLPTERTISEQRGRLQGAGSVKRDAVIWEDFLTDIGVTFKAQKPIKGATKISKEIFRNMTGYKHQTSEHSRDAAMLVFGF